MPRNFVNRVFSEISAQTIGQKELSTVKKVQIGLSDPKKPVTTMNRKRRALGYSQGVPEFKVDLDVVVDVGPNPEVDWEKLQLTGEIFDYVYEEGEDGRRFQCIDVTVDDITKPFDDAGETVRTVKCTALDHKPE